MGGHIESSYMPRVADAQLDAALRRIGAVLVRGAKWCGKTRTAERRAKSTLSLQDPRQGPRLRQMAESDPLGLLLGEAPRLIDEWQVAPGIWDAIRYEVDRRREPGQFILTGSAVPVTGGALHTGTGRIARVTLRPMALYESGESNGCVSLGRLFESGPGASGAEVSGESGLTLPYIACITCRGGWPEAVRAFHRGRYEEALALPDDYLEAVIESDVSRADGRRHSPGIARTLLRSLARFSAQPAKLTTICEDLCASGIPIKVKTVQVYVNALRRLFVVEPLGGWAPGMRSKKALRTAPTWHYVDPSIACAALGASPERLIEDPLTFGFLFETLCVRDLRVYSEAIGGSVHHYRDEGQGLEVDAIVQLRDGRWGAIEVKLGSDEAIEKGARSLRRFAEELEPGVRPPEFLLVLTATGKAHARDDGVLVTPIGCLGP